MKIGFIGCGLIGTKRAEYLNSKHIIIAFDKNKKTLQNFSNKFNCIQAQTLNNIFDYNLDLVIIAVTHDLLSKFTLISLENNCNVLVEKPGSIIIKDLNKIKKLSLRKKLLVKIGFNHRYKSSFLKLKKIFEMQSKRDKILYIKASYGHGGRKNYNYEWRMNTLKSGGGELIDQGSHLINLSLWFLKDLKLEHSFLMDYFWKKNIDDNAFLLLKTKKNQIVSIHASWTEWKNSFKFEVFMKQNKFIIDGIGKSYGKERLIWYQMDKSLKPPKKKIFNFSKNDTSWRKENIEMIKMIRNKKFDTNSLDECVALNKLILDAYKKNRGGKIKFNYK